MVSKIDKHFDRILALVAGGMTVKAALASDPAFPGKATFKAYVRGATHPENRARLEAALQTGRKAESRSYRSRKFTEDQFDAALMVIATSDPITPLEDLDFQDGPNMGTLRMRANQYPAFADRLTKAIAAQGRQWGGRPATWTDIDYSAALALIASEGMRTYREKARGKLPSYTMIYEKARADRGFLFRLTKAVTDYIDSAAQSTLAASLKRNELFSAITAALPRRVDPSDQHDIVHDLIADVLAGAIHTAEAIIAAPKYAASHSRRFSTFEFASLDEMIFDSAATTRLDRVSTADWSWEGAI